MESDKLIAVLQKHYVIIALVPIATGASYLSGYLMPLGYYALQFVSYVDFIDFSLVFAVFLLFTALPSLYIIVANIAFLKYTKRKNRFLSGFVPVAVAVCVFVMLVVYAVVAQSKSSANLAFASVVGGVAPAMYVYFVEEKKSETIITLIAFVLVGSFSYGIGYGLLKKNYLDVVDQVCTDRCYRVGLYAILSDVVISMDCGGRVFYFPRTEVKKIIAGKRIAGGGDGENAVGDSSKCSLEPREKD